MNKIVLGVLCVLISGIFMYAMSTKNAYLTEDLRNFVKVFVSFHVKTVGYAVSTWKNLVKNFKQTDNGGIFYVDFEDKKGLENLWIDEEEIELLKMKLKRNGFADPGLVIKKEAEKFTGRDIFDEDWLKAVWEEEIMDGKEKKKKDLIDGFFRNLTFPDYRRFIFLSPKIKKAAVKQNVDFIEEDELSFGLGYRVFLTNEDELCMELDLKSLGNVLRCCFEFEKEIPDRIYFRNGIFKGDKYVFKITDSDTFVAYVELANKDCYERGSVKKFKEEGFSKYFLTVKTNGEKFKEYFEALKTYDFYKRICAYGPFEPLFGDFDGVRQKMMYLFRLCGITYDWKIFYYGKALLYKNCKFIEVSRGKGQDVYRASYFEKGIWTLDIVDGNCNLFERKHLNISSMEVMEGMYWKNPQWLEQFAKQIKAG
jgi:hypothetical protein